jgi:hypothetical protein
MNFNINRNVHLISVITIGASDGTDGRRLRAQSKCSVYSQVILPRVLLENVILFFINIILKKLFLNQVL